MVLGQRRHPPVRLRDLLPIEVPKYVEHALNDTRRMTRYYHP
jgi:hypothetical protein